MGSFSWMKADCPKDGHENVVHGEPFKFLIPKEFGGGFIIDNYQDYGLLGVKENGESKYDMYELQAFWNFPENVSYSGDFPKMKEIDDFTEGNRILGIRKGCFNEEIDKLKYPLKLVSVEYEGSYEDLTYPSYGDPHQGSSRIYKDKG